MAMLISPVGNFPLNDDWVYGSAVKHILQTGHFTLPSAASANVFVQIYWGALFCLPFGFSFTALRLSTLTLGWAGMLALYLLLREIGGTRRVAVAGALTLAFNPIYLTLAASFMTDVPFTSVFTISLWMYVRGVRRHEPGMVLGAFIAAFAAIFIRQFGLVLLLGFAVAQIARTGFSWRSLAAAGLPVIAGFALQLAYDHWLIATGRTPAIPIALNQLFPNSPYMFAVFVVHIVKKLPDLLPYPGFFMAPLWIYLTFMQRRACITNQRNLLELSSLALLTLAAVAFVIDKGVMVPLLGNILTLSGIGPLTLRDTWLLHLNIPRISSTAVCLWALVTILSAAITVSISWTIGIAAAGVVFRRRQADDWMMMLVLTIIITYAIGTLLALGENGLLFDRYLLPLIPVTAAALVCRPGYNWQPGLAAWRMAPCGFVLAMYAVYGLFVTHDYLAWNRARWQATDLLLASGVPASRIDGGYEFNGWYLYETGYQEQPDKSYWWVMYDTYLITSGDVPGYVALKKIHFSRWLGAKNSNIFILKRDAN
jgi:hypothetical protein